MKLPQGLWLYVSDIPSGTSATEIAEWFCKNGMGITEQHVSARENFNSVTAIVSIPSEEVLHLIRWAVTREPFDGNNDLRVERYGVNSDAPPRRCLNHV